MLTYFLFFFFFSALKDLNGSVAPSEVQVKSGICLRSYACRHTDRTVSGFWYNREGVY